MPAVAFRDVSASRGGRSVLHDVSLTVGARETVALVGRSGSGKTTLLRLVNRLISPDAGQVMVDDQDVATWDPIVLRRRIGYVIQEAGLFPHMTVAGNIATVPILLNWDANRIRARVDELLSLVGLEPGQFRHRWPDELSGGERQRVGLARALLSQARLLLVDEPLSALDPARAGQAVSTLSQAAAEKGATLVATLHDVPVALQHFPRIVGLRAGQLVFDLPSAQVTPELLQDLYAQEAQAEPVLPLVDPATAPRGVAMTCR